MSPVAVLITIVTMDTNKTPSQRGWKRAKNCIGGTEYVHTCGARVYQHIHRAFRGAEWGLQLSTDKQGDSGYASMREAMAFVERHDRGIAR